MGLQTHITLNTGAKIPTLGFGTWQAKPGEVEQAVEAALKVGFRHIDCASIYRNEQEVGKGIQKSGIARSDIFITGKLWNTHHAPEDVQVGLDNTLRDLGTDYLDLFLMHWPVAFKNTGKWFPLEEDGTFALADVDPSTTWAAMEKLLATGKVKAIGISNFTVQRIERLLQNATIVPAVNQIEAHPYLQQTELVKYCQSNGIYIEAYSPLGNNQTGEPRTVDDPVVGELSEKTGLSGAQLLLSWGVQRGTVVLSKSVTPSRIESNLKLQELSEDTFTKLTELEKNKRFNWQTRWGFDIFEELGVEKAKQLGQSSADENKKMFG